MLRVVITLETVIMAAWLKDGDLVAERKSINVKIAREKKELEINNN